MPDPKGGYDPVRKKNNAGFSLIEVLLSIVILAAVVIPTCSAMVMSYRLNAKSEQMMQSQLAVSSAVETLMASGITDDYIDSLQKGEDGSYISSQFDGLVFRLTENSGYYDVTVTDSEGLVEVATAIRKAAESTKTLSEVPTR